MIKPSDLSHIEYDWSRDIEEQEQLEAHVDHHLRNAIAYPVHIPKPAGYKPHNVATVLKLFGDHWVVGPPTSPSHIASLWPPQPPDEEVH